MWRSESPSQTVLSTATSSAEVEAQNTLLHLLRVERAEALHSLTAAKSELQNAKDDLQRTVQQRQQFLQNQQASSTNHNHHQNNSSLSPPRGTNAAEDRDLSTLNGEIADNNNNNKAVGGSSGGTVSVHSLRQILSHGRGMGSPSGGTITAISALPTPQQQQRLQSASPPSSSRRFAETPLANHPLGPASSMEGGLVRSSASATSNAVGEELAAHIRLTNAQMDDMHRRVERYDTELQTAMCRMEELQLRLEASAAREQSLKEQNATLEYELTAARVSLNEQNTATDALKTEVHRLMTRLESTLDLHAESQVALEGHVVEQKALRAENNERKAVNEALQKRLSNVEAELATVRGMYERRDQEQREKITRLSKELTSVREQRDQALRPYHARHAATGFAPATVAPSYGSGSSPSFLLSPQPTLLPNAGYTTHSPSGGPSPAPGTPTASRSQPPRFSSQEGLHRHPTTPHSSTTNTNPPPHDTAAEVWELKRQVQWLLERSSP